VPAQREVQPAADPAALEAAQARISQLEQYVQDLENRVSALETAQAQPRRRFGRSG
jgi:exonuclease VII small subunit